MRGAYHFKTAANLFSTEKVLCILGKFSDNWRSTDKEHISNSGAIFPMEEEVEGTQEVLPARGSGLLCPPRCPPLPILNATFPSVADPCLLPAQPVAKSPTALFILPTSPALRRSSLHDPVPMSLPPRCPGRSLLCSEGACPAVLPRGVGQAGPHSADFPDPPPRRAWLSLAPLAPAGAPGVGVKAGHSWRRPRGERARGEQPRTQRFALSGLEAAGPAPEAASSVSRG